MNVRSATQSLNYRQFLFVLMGSRFGIDAYLRFAVILTCLNGNWGVEVNVIPKRRNYLYLRISLPNRVKGDCS